MMDGRCLITRNATSRVLRALKGLNHERPENSTCSCAVSRFQYSRAEQPSFYSNRIELVGYIPISSQAVLSKEISMRTSWAPAGMAMAAAATASYHHNNIATQEPSTLNPSGWRLRRVQGLINSHTYHTRVLKLGIPLANIGVQGDPWRPSPQWQSYGPFEKFRIGWLVDNQSRACFGSGLNESQRLASSQVASRYVCRNPHACCNLPWRAGRCSTCHFRYPQR